MTETITVMTYNVHSCVGTDGKLSPFRIAEVVARHGPDVAALQELDSGLVRTGFVDQAALIARQLNMHYHFHPALAMEAGQYGNAILSRLHMRVRRAAELPSLPGRDIREKRGALWAKVAVGKGQLQFISTHLGLSRKERRAQASSLLGSQWLGHPECRPPVILCGDLNSTAWGAAYRLLCGTLLDVPRLLGKARRTWPARLPLMRLDHVLVSPDVYAEDVEVPADSLALAASDHLPVIARLKVRDEGDVDEQNP
jgi:endonuclease/exonuclease/phosphatase family metal-dependent hydrolase